LFKLFSGRKNKNIYLKRTMNERGEGTKNDELRTMNDERADARRFIVRETTNQLALARSSFIVGVFQNVVLCYVSKVFSNAQ
jgi:hypothetical protein